MPPAVTHGCGSCADDGRGCGAAAASIGPGAGAGLTRGRAAQADSAAGPRGPGVGAVSSPGRRCARGRDPGRGQRLLWRGRPGCWRPRLRAALLATVTPASLSLTNHAACGPARTGACGGAGRAGGRCGDVAMPSGMGAGPAVAVAAPGPVRVAVARAIGRDGAPSRLAAVGPAAVAGPARTRRGGGRERDRGPCVDDRHPRRAGVGQQLRAALQQLGQRLPADHATVPLEDGVALPGAGEPRPLGAPVQPGQQLGAQGPDCGLIRWRHSAGCHRARLPGDRAGDALREPARLTQERRGEPLVD